jgi:hypothetical protein
LLQELHLLPQRFLHHFSPIPQQVPAIQHLLRLWCSVARSDSVAGPSIAADHLDPLVGLEPFLEDLITAAHQQVYHPMVLQIDQNGSAGVLALKSPIVHS